MYDHNDTTSQRDSGVVRCAIPCLSDLIFLHKVIASDKLDVRVPNLSASFFHADTGSSNVVQNLVTSDVTRVFAALHKVFAHNLCKNSLTTGVTHWPIS